MISQALADDLEAEARALLDKQAAKLTEVAEWCDEKGLTEQAAITRRLLRPDDPNRMFFTVLPKTIGRPALPDDASEVLARCDTGLAQLREEQADALFDLARRSVRAGRASAAFDLLMEAIHQNPDHEEIRRLLGYQKYRDQWCTAYEVTKLRTGQIWHERFGWIPKTHVEKHEDGQRLYRGRWISADEDARLHEDIESGWEIETEHYTVHTNHGLDSGVAFAEKLETLYRVWKQLFLRYYASQSQVASLFGGGGTRIQLPRHHVVYYRDRDEYNRHLRSMFPSIEMSLGVYESHTHRAHFFAGEDFDEPTLFHEATHQLFHETRRVAPMVAQKSNFWIVEGAAMLMESLKQENGYHVLGGFDDARMKAARYRLLVDDFYVPLGEFTRYGMRDIQTDKRIATLYSQAAGLTHFLVFYDGGRYRDALVAYLLAIYSGGDSSATLSRLTDTSFDELDRQYRQFMAKGPGA